MTMITSRTNINQASTNYVHCGVDNLSMSKHIMKSVFDCANDCNVIIYYQDTDSLSISTQLRDIKQQTEYTDKPYNIEQFHPSIVSDIK